LWEWWTAENSDGFHNPELARESLTASVDESMAGIKIIDDALAAKMRQLHNNKSRQNNNIEKGGYPLFS